MADIMQQFKNMTTRQKVTAGVFILILIIIIWQVAGLFGGGGTTTPVPAPATRPTTMTGAAPGAAPGMAQPQPQKPLPAQLQKQQPMSQREMELLKLQQETQTKYLSALNELQMLRVERELAETNQAIATARLATVTAQKGIVDLLAPPAPQITPDYARGLVMPGTARPAQPTQPPIQMPPTISAPSQPEISYTVISVSQLRYKWNAVLGYQGSLYNVTVGDILPPDGSKVVSIDRSGVILEKNNVRKKISLVPII